MFESLELKTQLNKLMKTKRVNKRLVYVSKGLFTFDFWLFVHSFSNLGEGIGGHKNGLVSIKSSGIAFSPCIS